MGEIRITQTRSAIGGTASQRATLKTLGLKRIGDSTVRTADDSVRGMVRTVAHLVAVEEARQS